MGPRGERRGTSRAPGHGRNPPFNPAAAPRARGAEMTATTVVEERERGIRAGPHPRSGAGTAAATVVEERNR
jgi:hypothetical protein